MVTIKIEPNRSTLLIFFGVLILLGASIIIAYNPSGIGDPSVMGHSLNEIDLPDCGDDQILKRSGTSWVCGDLPSSGGSGSGSNAYICLAYCKGGGFDREHKIFGSATDISGNYACGAYSFAAPSGSPYYDRVNCIEN